MSNETHISAPSNAARGYLVNLAVATGAAGLGGFALWAAQNLNLGEPLWWRVGGLAAGLLAAKLTLAATKQRQEMRRSLATGEDGERPRRALLAAFAARYDAAVAALGHTPESEAGAALPTTQTPAPSRIEAERMRLAKAGFNETEISQILIAKETGAAQGMGGGHGVLSGVLSNLAAVMTHARNFVPHLVADLARMLNRHLPLAQRVEALFTFAAKCAVIGVLAYVVELEFTQLKALSDKAKAEACIERQKNAINFSSMNELLSGHGMSDLDRECKNL